MSFLIPHLKAIVYVLPRKHTHTVLRVIFSMMFDLKELEFCGKANCKMQAVQVKVKKKRLY